MLNMYNTMSIMFANMDQLTTVCSGAMYYIPFAKTDFVIAKHSVTFRWWNSTLIKHTSATLHHIVKFR